MFGQVIVNLDGIQLLRVVDGIFDYEVEFWIIECSFVKFGYGIQVYFFGGFNDSVFGGFLVFGRINVFIWVFGVV